MWFYVTNHELTWDFNAQLLMSIGVMIDYYLNHNIGNMNRCLKEKNKPTIKNGNVMSILKRSLYTVRYIYR